MLDKLKTAFVLFVIGSLSGLIIFGVNNLKGNPPPKVLSKFGTFHNTLHQDVEKKSAYLNT